MENKLLSIEDLKERFPGVSERQLRHKLRKAGTFRQIGNRLYLTQSDFAEFLESLKPKREKWQSPYPPGPSPNDTYARLVKLREQVQPQKRKLTPPGNE